MERQDIVVVIAVILLVLGGFSLAKAEPLPEQGSEGSPGLATVDIDERITPEPGVEPTAPPPTPIPNLVATIDDTQSLTAYPPTLPFVVQFSQAMDKDAVEFALTIEPPIAGTLAWLNGDEAVRFTPRDGFATGETYTISLAEGLTSVTGEALPEAYSWQIQVVNAPYVVERVPDTRVTSTERHPQISLRFDRAMDADSVATALHVNPPAPFELTWQDTVLLVDFAEPLAPGRVYQFTLDGTASDTNGLVINEPYRWSYRTANLQPSRATYPLPGSLDRPVTWRFSYPVDPSSVNLLIGPPAAGELTWEPDGTAFYYTFTEPLMGDTRYTIMLGEALHDMNGDPLPDLEPVSFTAPSTVQSHSPSESTTTPLTPVSLSFNWPVDQVSIEAAFSIEPAIAGYLEWHGDDLLEFHPDQGYLDTDVRYTVRIAPTALDSNGNALFERAYSWTFTTEVPEYVVSFGSGEHTQAVNADGARLLQYRFGYDAATEPIFEIYPYEVEHWLADDTPHGHQLLASWTETITPQGNEGGMAPVYETAIPADIAPGLYLVQLKVFGAVQDQLVVFVTRYGMVVQEDDQRLTAWVSDFAGNPAGQQTVYLYDLEGNQLQAAQTDGAGMVTFTRPETETQLLAIIDGQMAATRLDFVWRSQSASTRAPIVQVYTDQPVYRPDEDINFRALFQQYAGEAIQPLVGNPVTVTLRSQVDWETIDTQVITTNEFGTINSTFTLPDTAPVGAYQLSLTMDNRYYSSEFSVEAAKNTEGLQVVVSPASPLFSTGAEAQILVTVTDSNGAPVAGATVQAELFKNHRAYGYGCGGERGFSGRWQPTYEDDTVYSQTDSEGQTLVSPSLLWDEYATHTGPHSNSMQHVRFALLATVRLDGEMQVNFSAFEVANAEEEIVLEMDSILQTAATPFTVTGLVQDLAGNPVPNRSLVVRVQRDDLTLMATDTVVTDPAGRIAYPVNLAEEGVYEVLVSGRDTLENTYSAEWSFYLNDTSNAPSETIDEGRNLLTLVADKSSYTPGQTAQLIIRSDFGGTALLSLERHTVQTTQLVQLTPPFTIVEVPITNELGSRFFATLHVWQANQQTLADMADSYIFNTLSDYTLRSAKATIDVANPASELTVEIIPHSEPVAGGETSFTLRVTDHTGAPVLAELSLAMVDEFVYSRYASHRSHLSSTLANYLPVGVNVYNSLHPSRSFDGFGGCGCGGGDWWDSDEALYSPFQSDGAWFGALVTDGNGEVVVTLTVPVNPAGWRLTTNAITQDGRASEAYLTILNN